MKKTFYSNGKLLITGEYVVLDGAIALALPTKMGQELIVDKGSDKQIFWKSYDADGSIWFDEVILFSDIIRKKIFEQSVVKTTLIEILHEAYILNPSFIDQADGYLVSTNLTFLKIWGLGTSSTLINNIANWLQVDAFVLLNKAFGGSGYDIACAQNNSAILYQLQNKKPSVKAINFNPIFKENLYFVYLNIKQNSRNAIANYKSKKGNIDKLIVEINNFTNIIATTSDYTEFVEALENHENILAKILEIQTVKETFFSDFNGTIKSLGAWGGDFVLVASQQNPTSYFESRGYKTIISYSEIIL